MLPEENKSQNSPMNSPRRAALGFVFILFGLLFLSRNYDFMPPIISEYLISWQSILIAIGLIGLIKGRGHYLGSVILIGLGSYFIINDLYSIPFNTRQVLLAALFIYIGLHILFGKKHHQGNWHQRFHQNDISVDMLDDVNIFGGSKINVVSQQFKGGEVTGIFGGSEINLSAAKLAEGISTLEVTFVFGGVKLIVPNDWNVKMEVTGILGGFSDKRMNIQPSNDSSRTLIIRGTCVFGGGELKSY